MIPITVIIAEDDLFFGIFSIDFPVIDEKLLEASFKLFLKLIGIIAFTIFCVFKDFSFPLHFSDSAGLLPGNSH